MANIKKSDLATISTLVEQFNNTIWSLLQGKFGYGEHLHVNESSMFVMKRYFSNYYTKTPVTSLTLSNDTAPGATIVVQGVPKTWGSSAVVGANKVKGTAAKAKPVVIKKHLATLARETANPETVKRVGLTLKISDIEENEHGEIINANKVYKACFDVINVLMNIRPMFVTWRHNHGKSGELKESKTFYGIFNDVDNDSIYGGVNSTEDTSISKTDYSTVTYLQRGTKFSIYSRLTTPNAVDRIKTTQFTTDKNILASTVSPVINEFWSAWNNKNGTSSDSNHFKYSVYSCHYSCHYNCHGAGRHRR